MKIKVLVIVLFLLLCGQVFGAGSKWRVTAVGDIDKDGYLLLDKQTKPVAELYGPLDNLPGHPDWVIKPYPGNTPPKLVCPGPVPKWEPPKQVVKQPEKNTPLSSNLALQRFKYLCAGIAIIICAVFALLVVADNLSK